MSLQTGDYDFATFGKILKAKIDTDGFISWDTKSVISSPVDGHLLLTDAAGTDFSLLQLGGTTTAYPAIKRSGNLIYFRLADDSNYCHINALGVYANYTMRTTANNVIGWQGRAYMAAPVDGNITLLNNAQTDFGLLQFGGITNAFPALKRSGDDLEVRRADDSAYSSLLAGGFVSTGSITTSASGYCSFQARTRLSCPINGNLLFTDWAVGDFGLLQFGGTTNSFPALKRNSTILEVRLANDSGYTGFRADFVLGDSNIRTLAAGYIGWTNRSRMLSLSDGNITLYNNLKTDFGVLQFGGTNTSFPALKRSSATLEVRLADDSDYADLVSEELSAQAGFAAFGVTPPATQPSKISDPSGGTTIDSEARTAINAIIDVLEGAGLSASA